MHVHLNIPVTDAAARRSPICGDLIKVLTKEDLEALTEGQLTELGQVATAPGADNKPRHWSDRLSVPEPTIEEIGKALDFRIAEKAEKAALAERDKAKKIAKGEEIARQWLDDHEGDPASTIHAGRSYLDNPHEVGGPCYGYEEIPPKGTLGDRVAVVLATARGIAAERNAEHAERKAECKAEAERNREAEKAFNIVVPDTVLYYPTVLPQGTWGTTDRIKRAGGAQYCRV